MSAQADAMSFPVDGLLGRRLRVRPGPGASPTAEVQLDGLVREVIAWTEPRSHASRGSEDALLEGGREAPARSTCAGPSSL
jgi:hypothetical protein